jgi:two-component system cell cycle sensor histidine kinase/response regulator CckA
VNQSISYKLLNALPEPVWVVRLDNLHFSAVNDAAVARFGYSRAEFLSMQLADLLQERDLKRFRSVTTSAQPEIYDLLGWRVKTRHHDPVSVDISLCVKSYDGVPSAILMPLDASARQTLEDQLRQSKKLEAVGMLAGGIAHDFNNLLTIISGYGQLLMANLSEHDRSAMEQLLKASERAAGLTRQLLAYSRRQDLQPKTLNLNEVVSELSPMLRRLIGEHIDVRIELSQNAGSIHGDPGQIEQVIMNLVVNARDAMTNGGTLVIETSNIELDEAFVSRRQTVRPGQYVMLAVTDTGIGMD